jgi:bifunctional UDP-N-acetylglucosamine pyrophosphorylase/glucosamine-1-phosphate N-acetyltransferase
MSRVARHFVLLPLSESIVTVAENFYRYFAAGVIMTESISCVVLAAGKGTRMKSNRAKVLHEVFFAPMIHHVLEAVHNQRFDHIIVVVGHQMERVQEALKEYTISFVVQEEQLGTGHAVLCARDQLVPVGGTVLILCGDTPLIRAATLARMLTEHRAQKALLTVMTTRLADPTNYGRIVCDAQGAVLKIVEEKDASPEQRQIDEINAGIYCADSTFLFEALQQVGSDNSQGEVYLTDIVELANRAGHRVNRFAGVDAEEVLGVNSRVELAAAHNCLQQRYNEELMLSGVTLVNPETVAIQKGVTIEPDTSIGPNVLITGQTRIGKGCQINANVVIRDSLLGDEVMVGPFSYLDNCRIETGQTLPPYSVKTPD